MDTCIHMTESLPCSPASITTLSMGYAAAAAAAAAKSLQSCPTLCDPIDISPPGSAVLGILHARTLEWVAISFSIAWKWKVKVKSLSRERLVATPWTVAHQAPPSMGFSRQEYWSGLPLPSPVHGLYPSAKRKVYKRKKKKVPQPELSQHCSWAIPQCKIKFRKKKKKKSLQYHVRIWVSHLSSCDPRVHVLATTHILSRH